MKNILFAFFTAMLLISACDAQTPKKATVATTTSDKVEAYYFHMTSRCATCKSVEEVTQQHLAELYPELVKQSKITFKSINLEEAEGKALAAKLKISGQSLILVSGDKVENITNQGFMYARSNPDKLKAIIKEKVDALLN
jgi:uncharacterized protein YdbL (DUF1318 family)